MAEVLLEYRNPAFARDGRAYRVQAWGAAALDGTRRWCGWIVFLPVSGGPPLQTAGETIQPNRRCTVYWSTGLTPAYLKGALERALQRDAVSAVAAGVRSRREMSPRRCSGTPPSPDLGPANPMLKLTQSDQRLLKSLGISGA
jgi:hypothetical protein